MKTELEEAAEKEFPLIDTEWCRTGACEEENLHLLGHRKSFIAGAKWQSKRMYSEEEVERLAFDFYYDMSRQMGVAENLISENATNVDMWFEQFKKK